MFLPVMLLAAGAVLQSPEAAAARFDVLHYDARVQPDLPGKTVKGLVVLEILARADTIDLDIGALTIDRVLVDGTPAEFSQGERRLHVPLKALAARPGRQRLDVEYHGAPRFGLEFVPEKSQAYTIFSTSQWLPCVDAPGDKATLRLTLILPKGLVVVANGRQVSTRADGDLTVHEWRLDEPAPTYTFGFAAGPFNEATDKRGGRRLRYLSSDASADTLRRIFVDTKDMLAFFEDRSGVEYGSRSYTQALVAKTIGQELEGFSLMSEEYGQGVVNDPTSIGLIAHELAHQWWGNSVTCSDWTHFWLNEGFATFMAAAYREKRFGREVYLKDVAGWRARYERVKAAGKDRSLVFPDWNRPTSDDRALVYHKGALVLHELRERLGDAAFWKGLRAYTRSHRRSSVVTADFERAMTESAGKDLSAFFAEWIHAREPTRP